MTARDSNLNDPMLPSSDVQPRVFLQRLPRRPSSRFMDLQARLS